LPEPDNSLSDTFGLVMAESNFSEHLVQQELQEFDVARAALRRFPLSAVDREPTVL
jgi:hypothetical protein